MCAYLRVRDVGGKAERDRARDGRRVKSGRSVRSGCKRAYGKQNEGPYVITTGVGSVRAMACEWGCVRVVVVRDGDVVGQICWPSAEMGAGNVVVLRSLSAERSSRRERHDGVPASGARYRAGGLCALLCFHGWKAARAFTGSRAALQKLVYQYGTCRISRSPCTHR